jgi:hypothetical protein
MEPKEYLQKVLEGQDLQDDSKELQDLQKHRKDVEKVIRDGFPDGSPTIQYGGSKAKGTLIRESYDLDVVCYFPHDNNTAGETLKEIFQNVQKKLADNYYVEPKTSALRLRDKEERRIDFHIDVVPGRYVDDSKTDCFIYQNGGEKDRLKTNLGVHVTHVKDSGVVPAIRLLKLWKTRRGLQVKQFAFELLIIKLLKDKKKSLLDEQLKYVWTSLKDTEDPITVEDPANPTGNDLSHFIKSAWSELSMRSDDTLSLIENSGWEQVFGPVDEEKETEKTSGLKRAVAVITMPSKPWGV